MIQKVEAVGYKAVPLTLLVHMPPAQTEEEAHTTLAIEEMTYASWCSAYEDD